MRLVDEWVAFSKFLMDEFRKKRSANRDGIVYTGPLDDDTYRIMRGMADQNMRDTLFSRPLISTVRYNLITTIVRLNRAIEVIDHLELTWPNDTIILGVWHADTGIQAGMRLDENGVLQGEPLYPISNRTWRFIPGSTGNDDLRDVSLMFGHRARDFTDYPTGTTLGVFCL